ncbi:hypothetical protein OHA04_45780 (plasmid) [Streptomyces sp. NBC_01590]|uniref:hypothetical protein n=1 Tax=Streptomyces sp. NBC_01590 TaxID=2975887 RepID=UPI002F910049
MADDVDGSARIRITLDDSGVAAEARALGVRIKGALERGMRGVGRDLERQLRAVRITVVPDLRRFDAQLLDGLRSLDSINLPVAPDLTGFVERLRVALAGEELSIRVVPDLSDFDARVRAHRPPDITVGVNGDTDGFTRSLSTLGSVAGRVVPAVLGALKFGAIGTAAAAASSGVLSLAASLASIGGIAAAVPAAIGGVVIATTALKLALSGVGDAFGAALTEDSKQFEKALEELSPVAQKVARELRALRPAFDELKNTVQDAFFKPLVGQVTGLAKALGGPLRSALSTISGQFGTAAGQVAQFVRSADGVAAVKQTLTGTTAATRGLAAAINPVAQGFARLAGEISAAFGAELGSTIEDIGKKVGAFLSGAATSGQALTWVSDAVGVLKTLGGTLLNIGGILHSVLGAAAQTGGGLLNTLRDLTGQAAAFLKSAAGSSALQGLLSGLAGVGAQLGPIFGALVKQVGGLVPALLPVIKSLGKAVVTLLDGLDLRAVAEGLAPVADGLLEAIRLIAPQLKPVSEALGGLLAAVSPLLPVIGRLVALVGKELAFTVKALTPAFDFLVELLAAALNPIIDLAEGGFRLLSGAIKAAWSILGPFVKLVGGALVAAFRKLSESGIVAAVFDKLVGALRKLKPFFDTAAPAAAQLARDLKKLGQDVLAQLLPALGRLKKEIAPSLAPLQKLGGDVMRQVAKGAASAGQSLARLLTKVTPLARELLRVVKPVAQLAMSFLRMHVLDGLPQKMDLLVAVLRGLGGAVLDVIGDVLSFVGRVIDAFQWLYDVLVGHSIIPDLITAIISWFTQLPGQVLGIVSGFVSSAVSFFAQLPAQIVASLSQLGAALQTSITAGLTSVTVTLQTWAAGAVAWFASLPARIWAAMSSLGGLLAGLFSSALSSASAAASSGLALLTGMFGGLPARIWTVLSSLPGRLSALFRTAGTAALGAARTGGSAVVALFTSLPGRISGALGSLGSRLAGVFRSALGSARSAASSLISSIVGMFSGLGAKIVASIGDIGSQIMGKVKGGLPSSVRGLLPFANGGIVTGPTPALIGEAGPEVVIPLTRPARARQLAEQSGLADFLAATSAQQPQASAARPGATITNHWTINEVGDGEATAKRVMRRMAMAYSM